MQLVAGRQYLILEYDDDWSRVRDYASGVEGMAPNNYLDLSSQIFVKEGAHLQKTEEPEHEGWLWMTDVDSNQTGWVEARSMVECAGCQHPCHGQVLDGKDDLEPDGRHDSQQAETNVFVKAKFVFDPERRNEIALQKNRIYQLIKHHDEDWLLVCDTVGGERGLAPIDFFDRVDGEFGAPNSMKEEGSTEGAGDQNAPFLEPRNRKESMILEAEGPYASEHEDVFPFQEGQRFELISEEDDDFFLVRSLTSRREGYVPKAFMRDVTTEHVHLAQRLASFKNVRSSEYLKEEATGSAINQRAVEQGSEDLETDEEDYVDVSKESHRESGFTSGRRNQPSQPNAREERPSSSDNSDEKYLTAVSTIPSTRRNPQPLPPRSGKVRRTPPPTPKMGVENLPPTPPRGGTEAKQPSKKRFSSSSSSSDDDDDGSDTKFVSLPQRLPPTTPTHLSARSKPSPSRRDPSPSRQAPSRIFHQSGKRSRDVARELFDQITEKQKRGERVLLQTVVESGGSNETMLSFWKGDELEYLGPGLDGFLRVVHLDTTIEGQVRQVDVTLIEESLWNHPWYHGRISKVTAFTLLKNASKGTYLVRRSTDGKSFTLQVKGAGPNSFNWTITEKNALFSIEGTRRFHNINDLIEHYSIPRNQLEDAKTHLKQAAERDRPQLRDESAWEIKR